MDELLGDRTADCRRKWLINCDSRTALSNDELEVRRRNEVQYRGVAGDGAKPHDSDVLCEL